MITGISRPALWCLAGACAVAFGTAVPWPPVLAGAAVVLLAGVRVGRGAPVVLAVLVLLGGMSAAAAGRRAEAAFVEPFRIERADVALSIRDDPLGPHATAVATPTTFDGRPWAGPPLGVGPLPATVAAGDVVIARGRIRAGERSVRGDPVAGFMDVDEVLEHHPATGTLFRVGNAIRERVRTAFSGATPDGALVRGLLIGDTSALPVNDSEDLRRAGLAHFVAVSGSNVALFLAVWWFLGLPLAVHPRMRAVFGMIGLAVFLVVTRWEPSVVRASAMAAVPLVGGVVGVPVDPWMALGVASGGLLLFSGDLLGSVGFQLSVAATAGVLVGVGLVSRRRPRWLWIPLGATIGAQSAVAPILLATFGSIPLLAPVANLLAAPVVSLTTAVGLVAVIVPIPWLVSSTMAGASMVLRIAEATAGGPQLGLAASGVACLVGAMCAWRPSRPIGLAMACLALLVVVGRGPQWPVEPTAVVLAVGQGDAIVVQDPTGAAMLIDGGSDPVLLDAKLRERGIRRLDVVAVTHGDADHVGGIAGLVGSMSIGTVWVPAFQAASPLLRQVVDEASRSGVPVREVHEGDTARLGSIVVEVLAPARRFLAENDGSIVTLVSAGRSILVPGDVEAIGQAELPPIRPDVLVVPHHGSATTDPRWLAATVGPLAVLSYGPNRYGHPSDDIVAVLLEAGAVVRRTDVEGDIVVPLGRARAVVDA